MNIPKPSPAFRFLFAFISFFSIGICADRKNDAIKAALAKPDRIVKASWFGWEAAEATAALQAAIYSGAKKVVIDNVGEWIVDRIFLTNDQELVFEKGVILSAKKGAFKGKTDALLNGLAVRNLRITGNGALLRMWKNDYFGPGYDRAEWRHALNLKSASNVMVSDIILKDSGGDGVYLGNAGKPHPPCCTDIVLRKVTCDGNARQGISVISAVNLLIEDCALINTSGTAPQAGIDWEPNLSNECLVNNVMRRTRIEGNAGDGIDLYLPNLTVTTRDISIRIEDCLVKGNRVGLALTLRGEDSPVGSIEVRGTRFLDPLTHGVILTDLPLHGPRLRFDRCAFTAGTSQTQGPAFPLLLACRNRPVSNFANIGFVRCEARVPTGRPYLAFQNTDDIGFQGLSGKVRVDAGGKKTTHDLASVNSTTGKPDPLVWTTPEAYKLKNYITNRIKALAMAAPVPPAIDGALDDAAWAAAPEAPVELRKDDATPAAVRTRAKLCWDSQALYLAIRCEEPYMDRIRDEVRKADGPVWTENEVEVFLDVKNDQQTFFQLLVNTLGTLADFKTDGTPDRKWDSGAKVAVAKGGDVWTVEMSIPWASLGSEPPAAGTVWGLNLCRVRRVVEPSEYTCLSPTFGLFARPQRFGQLSFK
ncbi:MAG: sugar-binding protein [Pseudomonadota bacterium]